MGVSFSEELSIQEPRYLGKTKNTSSNDFLFLFGQAKLTGSQGVTACRVQGFMELLFEGLVP